MRYLSGVGLITFMLLLSIPTFASAGTGTTDRIAPTVKLYTPFVSTRISATTTFKVRWSGSDVSGIDSYFVKYRPANDSTWTSWKVKTKATHAYFKGAAGRTYYFRVRARDRAGNTAWSKVGKTIVPYNEGANVERRIGFDGFFKGIWALEWDVFIRPSYYLNSVRYSYSAGNTIVYKLRNTDGIGLVTTKNWDRGRARIYIDGYHMATVDAYSWKRRARQLIYYFSFSKKGTHYLKIINEGTPGRTRFDVDGIVVGR